MASSVARVPREVAWHEDSTSGLVAGWLARVLLAVGWLAVGWLEGSAVWWSTGWWPGMHTAGPAEPVVVWPASPLHTPAGPVRYERGSVIV